MIIKEEELMSIFISNEIYRHIDYDLVWDNTEEYIEDYLMPGLFLDRDYLSQLLGQKLTIPDWTIGVWEKLK